MFVKRREFLLCLGLGLLASTSLNTLDLAQAYEPADLIISSKGDLPLILSAPHGGDQPVGSVPERTQGTTVQDAKTLELAKDVADLLEARFGKRPYLVLAKFSRKYVDANRSEQQGVESPEALPVYKAYHNQIDAYIAEIKQRFPNGAVLVDIHGQSEEPDKTFRGTRSGTTTTALCNRYGNAAIQGEKSIIGVLAAKGYTVHPSVDNLNVSEGTRFNGGHIVEAHGSNQPQGIDAIQLEFGRKHRDNPLLARDFADALAIFLTEYILPK